MTFILLVVLAFTVLAPMTSFSPMTVNDGGSIIVNLDVCSAEAPALSSNGEMPCVGLTSWTAAPTLSVSFCEPVHPVCAELILASRKEHPPRS